MNPVHLVILTCPNVTFCFFLFTQHDHSVSLSTAISQQELRVTMKRTRPTFMFCHYYKLNQSFLPFPTGSISAATKKHTLNMKYVDAASCSVQPPQEFQKPACHLHCQPTSPYIDKYKQVNMTSSSLFFPQILMSLPPWTLCLVAILTTN